MDTTDVTVTFVGDLDLAGASKLMERALPLLDREEGRQMTLDLAGVEFCDSSGITALVELHKRSAERGSQLRVVNMQPAVRRVVVDFAGLGDYLNVA